MNTQKGFILLMVIAVLTAASAALAIASFSARLGAKEVGVTIDLARAQSAADAVLARAALGLGEQKALYADGRPYKFIIDDVQMTYRLVNNRGLIDLNGAKGKLLTAFFIRLDLSRSDAEDMAAAILDWRDKNDRARQNGAESRAYQNAGLPPPGNRRFYDVSEMRGVLGMSAALYQAAAPYLTAGPGQSEPDPATAPALVLSLLDLSTAQRNEILDRRREGSAPALTQNSKPKKTEKQGKNQGSYRLLVESELPSGTKQAVQLVFSTGPRPGEYAILSRRTVPIGQGAQIYETKARDVNY
ncbi:MAG: hypothetical protein COA84_10830 [Robiginitomaculum sp.]|nr:MAG: hypothetical protein COA84_10830 [Robiginitomaculum sp.]